MFLHYTNDKFIFNEFEYLWASLRPLFLQSWTISPFIRTHKPHLNPPPFNIWAINPFICTFRLPFDLHSFNLRATFPFIRSYRPNVGPFTFLVSLWPYLRLWPLKLGPFWCNVGLLLAQLPSILRAYFLAHVPLIFGQLIGPFTFSITGLF
jgi:hypothetical protein